MATTYKIIKTFFQLRRAKSLEWTEVNPVLLLGEPGFETDTNKLKIGDGETPWNDLYYLDCDFSVSVDGKTISFNDEEKLHLYGYATANTGTVPSKGEDGTLNWIPVSNDERISDEEIYEIIDN